MFTVRRLLYLLEVACAALAAQVIFFREERYWIIWSVLSLALIPFNLAFRNRLAIVATSGVIFAICAWILAQPFFSAPIKIGFLLIISFLSALITQYYPRYFLPALMINLFSIMSFLIPDHFGNAFFRLYFILIGMVLVFIAQLIFLPSCFQFEIRQSARIVLNQLSKLYGEIFSCFLQAEYKDNLYLFERRIHQQKNACLAALNTYNKMVKSKNHKTESFSQRFAQMFDLVLDQGQLRWRVTDHTVFGLCRNELLSIAEELENIFSELSSGLRKKKYYLDIVGLNEKIKHLEENFQHVVQVAAREPMVFLLFIASLKEQSQQIAMLYDAMLHARLVVQHGEK